MSTPGHGPNKAHYAHRCVGYSGDKKRSEDYFRLGAKSGLPFCGCQNFEVQK